MKRYNSGGALFKQYLTPLNKGERDVMKTKFTALVIMVFSLMISSSVFAEGYLVTSDLWIRAVINTVEKGPIDAVWQKGGEDTTSRGDRVIWGHFYASPSDVTWGSQDNPDLFVKIWFDVSGRIDVNYFHVSVPDIEVYSDYPYDGTCDQHGTTTMDYRYVRHEYWTGTHNGGADLSGTWDFYTHPYGGGEFYEGKYILVQDDNTLSFYKSCGVFVCILTKTGNTVQGSNSDKTITGTVNSDNNEISGTWIDYNYSTFRLVKVSNSTTFIGSGSLVIQGEYCNETINVNTTSVCAYKEFENNGELDDFDIFAPHNNGWIGITIKTPELLASHTTFDIQWDNFRFKFAGTNVIGCHHDSGIDASSGTVTIDIYDGTRLKGSFAVVLDYGSNIAGSFDVNIR
jgi:hypothetical protein